LGVRRGFKGGAAYAPPKLDTNPNTNPNPNPRSTIAKGRYSQIWVSGADSKEGRRTPPQT